MTPQDALSESTAQRKARVRRWADDREQCSVCGLLRINVVHEPDPDNAPEGKEYYELLRSRLHAFRAKPGGRVNTMADKMTPQAALAATLHEAKCGCGAVCQFVDDPVYADQRPEFEERIRIDHSEAAAAILAALPPGWRLTAEPPLAKLRAEHEPVIDYGYEFTCKCGWDSEDRPGTESYFDHLLDAKMKETP